MKVEQTSYVATKKQLFRLYHKLPEDFLRETINDIISKCRNKKLEEIKNVRNITPNEFREFVKEVGQV
ncbi:hypothetical protein BTO06_04010 [Tenacibaculum sp. SZ-18]|uniref:hypothetical protein n=1 Tax=Tenacibaculum sp. SZ-18 TaxID=754423 RepID=UPI000C2D5A5C|nr:hypothetical protein [Tenacibaculum sp. SZ-18]AUC14357.1 hypothetical protein BTO06_04010 [Tenacibaculum sp. SZ-18]